MDHVESARANFRRGYNCAQAVAVAFCDLTGLGEEESARLACSFGGGMGRLREVCGAVSGMLLVAGILFGYSEPGNGEVKGQHYARVQELALAFERQNDTLICRDLLHLPAGHSSPVPEKRTGQYYADRPCERLVGEAAGILDRYLLDHPELLERNA